jgi:RNA polymerase sigma factor (TIGR02999 family)
MAAGAHLENAPEILMSDSQEASQGEITQLLVSWGGGDAEAADRLFSLLYQELRTLARRQLRRGRGDATLGTTALVHEAYLKLVDGARARLRDRNHFFALASRVMRQIVVDGARRKNAIKRGGSESRVPLDENAGATPSTVDELVAVDEALRKLEALDPRLGKLVELRFFGGLSVEECAGILATSPRTVKRDWQKARAFLYHEMGRTRRD